MKENPEKYQWHMMFLVISRPHMTNNLKRSDPTYKCNWAFLFRSLWCLREILSPIIGYNHLNTFINTHQNHVSICFKDLYCQLSLLALTALHCSSVSFCINPSQSIIPLSLFIPIMFYSLPLLLMFIF